ncbi:MAG TPA: hypothetical protein VF174_05450 [Micromonosporaceae bacterium]
MTVTTSPTSPGPPVADHRVLAPAFRMAASHRPPPPDDRVLGAFAWVTALGVIGLAVALRGLAAINAGIDPAWYQPTLAALGTCGVVLAVAGMVAAHRTGPRSRTPWILLALATVPTAVNLLLTATAL